MNECMAKKNRCKNENHMVEMLNEQKENVNYAFYMNKYCMQSVQNIALLPLFYVCFCCLYTYTHTRVIRHKHCMLVLFYFPVKEITRKRENRISTWHLK